MTDLIERLRQGPWVDGGGAKAMTNCMDQAADRIEVLEAENARLREAHDLVASIVADDGFPAEWIVRARKYVAAQTLDSERTANAALPFTVGEAP